LEFNISDGFGEKFMTSDLKLAALYPGGRSWSMVVSDCVIVVVIRLRPGFPDAI
jgi:hypothetical protein